MASDAKFRIMIVDDEKVIANTLAMIFSTEGYDAKAVYSAEQALQLLPEWLPNLAIIDVQLPGMNGVDLAIYMKEHFRDCKVSLFAGQAGTSDLLASARQGGHLLHIIEKPVHPSALLRLVSGLLDPPQGAPLPD